MNGTKSGKRDGTMKEEGGKRGDEGRMKGGG